MFLQVDKNKLEKRYMTRTTLVTTDSQFVIFGCDMQIYYKEPKWKVYLCKIIQRIVSFDRTVQPNFKISNQLILF